MLFSGKIRFHDVARLTARCVLFATICHYSPLFAAIHHHSRLFPLFVLFATVRYSRLFAIRVFQTPLFEPSQNFVYLSYILTNVDAFQLVCPKAGEYFSSGQEGGQHELIDETFEGCDSPCLIWK